MIAGAKALQFGREYAAPITEFVTKEEAEVWEIANLTGDTPSAICKSATRQALGMNERDPRSNH